MKLSRQLTGCLLLLTINNLVGLALILWNAQNLTRMGDIVQGLRQLQAQTPALKTAARPLPAGLGEPASAALTADTARPTP